MISNNVYEGKEETSSGVYGFGIAFGIALNIGTSIMNRKINKNDYWFDDSNSKYYNQWIDIKEVKKGCNSAEHLQKCKAAHKYN